jgi:hypothetical protein
MNYVVSEWEDGSHGFSPEQGLWMVCTRLRWGKFGAWLSACQSNAEDKSRRSQSEQMISILEHKCRKVLNEKTGRSDNKLIRREDLLKAVTSREDAHRDVLCLLSAQQIRPLEKIIYMQNAHAENNDLAVLPTELPYVFSNIGIVKEMISLLSRAD